MLRTASANTQIGKPSYTKEKLGTTKGKKNVPKRIELDRKSRGESTTSQESHQVNAGESEAVPHHEMFFFCFALSFY